MTEVSNKTIWMLFLASVFNLLIMTIGGFMLFSLLEDRMEWMENLKAYNERKTADRVTHSAVQEALDSLAAKNGLKPEVVAKYQPDAEFPKPPKPFWSDK